MTVSKRAVDAVPRMTVAEYLAWSERQEATYEFDGSRPVAMNGGTVTHDLMQFNVRTALKVRLAGTPCRAFGPGIRVPTGQGRLRYPDVVVACTPVEGRDRDVTAPVVVFKILSRSTERTDRGEKLMEYRAIPSLVRYVMVEQSVAEATVVTRVGDIWSIALLRDVDVLPMPEIGIELPIAEIYDEVTLLPTADEG